MIKLTLTPTTQPIVYIFEKKTIFIGKPTFTEAFVDLPLAKQELHTAHVKIEEQNGEFIAYNLANDPYTTINYMPFDKKNLNNGDILTIGQTPILFEGEVAESDKLRDILQSKIDQQYSTFETIESELRQFEQLLGVHADAKPIDDKFLAHDIDTLLERVEKLEKSLIPAEVSVAKTESQSKLATTTLTTVRTEDFPKSEEPSKTDSFPSHSVPPPEPKLPHEPKSWEEKHGATDRQAPPKRESLKDFYLSEFDDENENWNPLKEKKQAKPQTSFVINWKALLSATGLMSVSCILILGLVYLNFIGVSEEEELKAGEAVADIVMALNYAQINHTLPQNQNWSDPEFLKSNLSAILATEYKPLAEVDSHGQFTNSSYILRIYTNSDLNKFIVIAQPNASLLQWLIPKSTIVVDSNSMDLRKTTELKALNRLLINPTLDNTNSVEISSLVKQGKLIPISKLANKQNDNGFVTPKALALIRPGAENYIYNAIRYYHFGESLMNKTVSIYESEGDGQAIGQLIQEIDQFSKFPNIVLYSSEGIQKALQGQRALSTFVPQSKFLFAYLQFNTEGTVSSSHLLIDDNKNDLAEITPSIIEEKKSELLAPEAIIETTQAEPIKELSKESENLNRQKSKPFDRLFHSLHRERHKALTTINDQIGTLISSENQAAIPNFSEKLHELQKQYEAISKKYQSKMVMAISLLSLGDLLEEKGKLVGEASNAVIESKEKPFLEPIVPIQPTTKVSDVKIDENHPLYYKLMALYTARQQALKPLSDQMLALLHEEQNDSRKSQQLVSLENKYENLTKETQERIVKAISNLQHEYSGMPLIQFLSYVKASGLESFVQESMHQQPKENAKEQVSEKNLDARIASIKEAASLKELDESLSVVAKMLTMDNIPDTTLLISYQNKVHANTTSKLDEFLLSPKKLLASDELVEKNRTTIVRILKTSWVTDPDELDYYLNEFDLLIHRH